MRPVVKRQPERRVGAQWAMEPGYERRHKPDPRRVMSKAERDMLFAPTTKKELAA